MMVIRSRWILAAIVAVSCSAVPASALADSDAAQFESALSTDRTDAAQAGSAESTDRSDAAQSGWNGSEPAGAKVIAYPPAGFRGGDAPVDHPGATRAQPAPTTVEVVRPERTIVRDVDEILPLVLSSTAMLLVLLGIGFTLVRTRVVPGRSH
jgi:hypothetical protein